MELGQPNYPYELEFIWSVGIITSHSVRSLATLQGKQPLGQVIRGQETQAADTDLPLYPRICCSLSFPVSWVTYQSNWIDPVKTINFLFVKKFLPLYI